jgi:hypothetical protein
MISRSDQGDERRCGEFALRPARCARLGACGIYTANTTTQNGRSAETDRRHFVERPHLYHGDHVRPSVSSLLECPEDAVAAQMLGSRWASSGQIPPAIEIATGTASLGDAQVTGVMPARPAKTARRRRSAR